MNSTIIIVCTLGLGLVAFVFAFWIRNQIVMRRIRGILKHDPIEDHCFAIIAHWVHGSASHKWPYRFEKTESLSRHGREFALHLRERESRVMLFCTSWVTSSNSISAHPEFVIGLPDGPATPEKILAMKKFIVDECRIRCGLHRMYSS